MRGLLEQVPDGNRIVFAGASTQPLDWVAASHVYISASLHEGMPLAPLEAAGSGLPVILSDIPGHTFLCEYSSTFVARDAQSTADQIIKAIQGLDENNEEDVFKLYWDRSSKLRNDLGIHMMAVAYTRLFLSLWAPSNH